jgi:site-specific recombinase XerD
MAQIEGFYQKKGPSENTQKVLESFLPEDEVQTILAYESDSEILAYEDEDMYEGTRSTGERVCSNCNKKIQKPWRNTVQLIDGKHRVVPLCSEKCSEEYHPSR